MIDENKLFVNIRNKEMDFDYVPSQVSNISELFAIYSLGLSVLKIATDTLLADGEISQKEWDRRCWRIFKWFNYKMNLGKKELIMLRLKNES